MKTIVLIIIVGCFLIAFNSCSKKEVSSTGNTPQNGTVTDIDGNTYKTVTIGKQIWMVDNLKTTKYKDGTSIPNVTENNIWGSLLTPAYCWYNNDISYKNPYGALYNWYSINTGKLAPTGWHVPSDDEWTTLINYLGGTIEAGGKLKESGTSHWLSPNTGATNETGFTAIPNSTRSNTGTFSATGNIGLWWNTGEYSINNQILGRFLTIGSSSGTIYRGSGLKQQGRSVRCLKD